jgi:hypothetical protein
METFGHVPGRVDRGRAAACRAVAGGAGGALQIPPDHISQLERGLKSPTLRVFRGLAEALGTSGAELLRKKEGAG